MSTIDGKLQIKGWDETQAQIISNHGSYVPLAGELIRSSDGWETRGDGVNTYSSLKWYNYDQTTGKLRIYVGSGSAIMAVESGDDIAGSELENALGQWRSYISSVTGGYIIRDDTSDTAPIIIEQASENYSFYVAINNLIGFGTNSPEQEGHFKVSSGSCVLLIETEDDENAALMLRNELQAWQLICQDTAIGGASFDIYDTTNSKRPLSILPDAPTDSMVIEDDGGVFMSELRGSTGGVAMRYSTTTGELLYDTCASRYKENDRPYDGKIDIMKIPVTYYDRKDGSIKNEIGVYAEEMKKVFPQICFDSIKNKEEIIIVKDRNVKNKLDWMMKKKIVEAENKKLKTTFDKACEKADKKKDKLPPEPKYKAIPEAPVPEKLPENEYWIEGWDKLSLVPVLLYELQQERKARLSLEEKYDDILKRIEKSEK